MKKLLLSIFIFTFHFSFSQNGWLWGDNGKDGGTHLGVAQNVIATDNDGNCFYAGFLQGDSIKLGTHTLMNTVPLNADCFIIKFDKAGNIEWVKQSTQNGNYAFGNGYTVSTDAMGNAYFMANFTDTIVFGSYMLTTQRETNGYYYIDNFLVKYDPNGNVLWTRQSQIPSYYSGITGNSLVTEKKGNSYITGGFSDTASFGTITIKGLNDVAVYTFLVKYDANGNVKWVSQSSGHSQSGSEGTCVATNNMNGVFIAGFFIDSVTFGSYKLTSHTIYGDAFIVKYDTIGNVIWARQGSLPAYNFNDWAEARGITTDNFGNVYVTGVFSDTVIFSPDTLISAINDVFLVKYDSAGNVVWALSSHVLDDNEWGPASLSSDNKGDIFMSGGGGGYPGLCKICFGNDTLSVIDTSNDLPSFVVKFDSSGKVLCAIMNAYGGSNWSGIASDTSGNYVYFGGAVNTVAVIGNDTVYTYPNSNYGSTPFVARWWECDSSVVFAGTAPEIKQPSSTVKVYPNPNNGEFTLVCHSERSEESQSIIEVYNVLGEEILSETLQPQTPDRTGTGGPKGALNTIDLSNQPNGVYFYRVVAESGELIGNGKLILQK